jgi:hypothetical protein
MLDSKFFLRAAAAASTPLQRCSWSPAANSYTRAAGAENRAAVDAFVTVQSRNARLTGGSSTDLCGVAILLWHAMQGKQCMHMACMSNMTCSVAAVYSFQTVLQAAFRHPVAVGCGSPRRMFGQHAFGCRHIPCNNMHASHPCCPNNICQFCLASLVTTSDGLAFRAASLWGVPGLLVCMHPLAYISLTASGPSAAVLPGAGDSDGGLQRCWVLSCRTLSPGAVMFWC